MMIIRKKLTPDELVNPTQRYDPTCDCTQSLVGGDWVDNPNIDPRTSTALLLPPPSGGSPACDGAAAIVSNFRSGLTGTLAAINAAATAAAGASFILNFLDFLDGIGLLIQLLIDFCALVISIGTEAVEAAFTDDVYEALKCIIFCHISSDGTLTQAQLNAIELQVRTVYGEFSTVALIFGSWVESLGPVGLSNIASLKRETGDCDECSCSWCYEWANQTEMLADSWTPTSGTFWNAAFAASLTKISFTWTSDGVGQGGDSGAAIWLSNSFVDRVVLDTPLSSTPNPVEWTDVPTTVAGGIAFGLNAASGSGGVVAVATLHLEGVDERPAWTHGHEC